MASGSSCRLLAPSPNGRPTGSSPKASIKHGHGPPRGGRACPGMLHVCGAVDREASAPLAFSAQLFRGLEFGAWSVLALALLRLVRVARRGFLAGQGNALFHNRELQLALLRQDAVQNLLHAVAGAEAASGAFADNLVRVLAPGVAVAGERIDGNQM